MRKMSIIIILLLSIAVTITVIFMLSKKNMSKNDRPKLDLATYYSNESLCDTVDSRLFDTWSTIANQNRTLTEWLPSSFRNTLRRIDDTFIDLINLLMKQPYPVPEIASSTTDTILDTFQFKTGPENFNLVLRKYKLYKKALDEKQHYTPVYSDADSYLYESGFENLLYADVSITDPTKLVSKVWPLYNIELSYGKYGNYYLPNIVHDYSSILLYATLIQNQLFSGNSCYFLLTNEKEIIDTINALNLLQRGVENTYNGFRVNSAEYDRMIEAIYRGVLAP